MTFPVQLFYRQAPISETVWAASDNLVAQWQDHTGSNDNGSPNPLYTFVDSDSDADYVRLIDASGHIVTSGSRTLRFNMAAPSGTPASLGQSCEIRVTCRWFDVFGGANPDSGDPNLTLSLRQLTTTKATASAQTITTGFVEYVYALSQSEINSVTNWSDVNVQMVFEASGIDFDEEVSIYVSRVKVVFF